MKNAKHNFYINISIPKCVLVSLRTLKLAETNSALGKWLKNKNNNLSQTLILYTSKGEKLDGDREREEGGGSYTETGRKREVEGELLGEKERKRERNKLP